MTECIQETFGFQGLNSRKVEGQFDGGSITSDGGAILLREVNKGRGILSKFAKCFKDHRDPDLIEHPVEALLSQRIFGIALGYEDVNDHERLRLDPLFAVLSGKKDPTGSDRRCEKDQGKALAGKSTLNRLEITPSDANSESRYKKIVYDTKEIEHFFVDFFLESHKTPPERIVLDLDATDDRVHGSQEGKFFHGYYGDYCYLPLYIFCGEFLLCAKLRTSDRDGADGATEEVERIVSRIREQWPETRILLRGDSGFMREGLMSWCEGKGVDYLFGMAKNARLKKEIEQELSEAEKQYHETKEACRVYKDFSYQTLESWSHPRRVVGKAEWMEKGENPRFVVTSIPSEAMDAQSLYEKEYCARGEMENRIKEQQLHLFADRTSSATLRANQLRLWFSSVAYVLLQELRRVGLCATDWAKAQCQTIRLKLLKIGAQVKISARRVLLSFASGYPYQEIFQKVFSHLKQIYSAG
jgi:hypothetical protein